MICSWDLPEYCCPLSSVEISAAVWAGHSGSLGSFFWRPVREISLVFHCQHWEDQPQWTMPGNRVITKSETAQFVWTSVCLYEHAYYKRPFSLIYVAFNNTYVCSTLVTICSWCQCSPAKGKNSHYGIRCHNVTPSHKWENKYDLVKFGLLELNVSLSQ